MHYAREGYISAELLYITFIIIVGACISSFILAQFRQSLTVHHIVLAHHMFCL